MKIRCDFFYRISHGIYVINYVTTAIRYVTIKTVKAQYTNIHAWHTGYTFTMVILNYFHLHILGILSLYKAIAYFLFSFLLLLSVQSINGRTSAYTQTSLRLWLRQKKSICIRTIIIWVQHFIYNHKTSNVKKKNLMKR